MEDTRWVKKIEIISKFGRFGTVVKIDGVEVPNVKSVRFEHDVNNLPVVVLTMLAPNTELTGEASVVYKSVDMADANE